FVETPNVTLTCASAGAGLFALSPSLDALILVDLGGSGAVVDGHVLDATAVSVNGFGAYFARDAFGQGLPVANVWFTNNPDTCGAGGGTLLAAASCSVIARN